MEKKARQTPTYQTDPNSPFHPPPKLLFQYRFQFSGSCAAFNKPISQNQINFESKRFISKFVHYINNVKIKVAKYQTLIIIFIWKAVKINTNNDRDNIQYIIRKLYRKIVAKELCIGAAV